MNMMRAEHTNFMLDSILEAFGNDPLVDQEVVTWIGLMARGEVDLPDLVLAAGYRFNDQS